MLAKVPPSSPCVSGHHSAWHVLRQLYLLSLLLFLRFGKFHCSKTSLECRQPRSYLIFHTAQEWISESEGLEGRTLRLILGRTRLKVTDIGVNTRLNNPRSSQNVDGSLHLRAGQIPGSSAEMRSNWLSNLD